MESREAGGEGGDPVKAGRGGAGRGGARWASGVRMARSPLSFSPHFKDLGCVCKEPTRSPASRQDLRRALACV